MSTKQGKAENGLESPQKIVVAVRASKEIPKTALVWALTHVVHPGDGILLLVVVPSHNSGRKLWGFPRFAGDCANAHRRLNSGASAEQKSDITDSCTQTMLQLQDAYHQNKINVKVKILSGSPCGAVAAECNQARANWVVLDKQLKQEEKQCVEELQCNIVVMKRTQPKVLRLNLVASCEMKPIPGSLPPKIYKSFVKNSNHTDDSQNLSQVAAVTSDCSPKTGLQFSVIEIGASSTSSSDQPTSLQFISEANLGFKKVGAISEYENRNSDAGISDSDGESLTTPPTKEFQQLLSEILSGRQYSQNEVEGFSQRCNSNSHFSISKSLPQKLNRLDMRTRSIDFRHSADSGINANNREGMLMSRNIASGSPPLCSICQHTAPVFGKPPKLFSYDELELATGGFSDANFLAEGGFGSVHRGVLPDGQVVAIKQHKLASSQGDIEFCSEVEVLSCAQHRNVVMLIGFCVEDGRKLLAYEYICNGSLDTHLYDRDKGPLEWSARQKIAVGAARGLRYLHEECRVGCIVHRDMRPNNILITHDFEALVGDFGLARWQPNGDSAVDTRVIGTFGYLAPEYAQSGQITEKADVFSYGVVLLELISGKKAVDINRAKGQQCLTEWARPLLEQDATIHELMDPHIKSHYCKQEVKCMLLAASLCIRRNPVTRPRMSQILRILEGDMIIEPARFIPTPSHDNEVSTDREKELGKGIIWSVASEDMGGKYASKAMRTACENKGDGNLMQR
ncbi:hypothetical protein J5N97_004823 [Dioscorea zingiberensis]|uniref:Protein kinase domain-containing protein n=1 Tax=Dioscorea zingiberensis TaxID=325984 RepID=A0A9D5D8R5_9LILI|nr:hypothetical protein J5N97_004823 [Dioscorea zingiberensis]